MGKIKKQTREERLLKKRLAERRRYERIKSDEQLWKEKQEKNKHSYLRRKKEKKQLSIAEMTPRQQRLQRKAWRKNFKAFHSRKKAQKRIALLLENNTPPESEYESGNEFVRQNDVRHNDVRQNDVATPLSPSILSDENVMAKSSININKEVTSNSSGAKRRLRYKKDKIIQKLNVQIADLKKINEKYRKQIERRSKSNSLAQRELNNTGRKAIVKNHNIKERKARIEERRRNIKEDVIRFLGEDRHSRLCAGKKESIVKNKIKKQKRYLTDTLKNLHEKYKTERNVNISYPTFCRLRPFWILMPNINSRETCLCKLHVNVNLMIQALWQKKITTISSYRDLLAKTCCDAYSIDCLDRNCDNCKQKVVPYLQFSNDQEISYWQWKTRIQNVGETRRKMRITEKVKLRSPPLGVITNLELLLTDFYKHCRNIAGQYQAIAFLKNNLRVGSCIIHVDFSENYAVKCNEEIQSYHFGGSRKQVTLHTSVIYYRAADGGDLQHQSFCTISDCVRHDASAVWAHIVPILEFISENICPNLNCIHFISDSPSSQYRNKKMFHVIASFQQYIESLRTITWNFTESGHGKGAPDGVGAAIKQAADRTVSCGKDITDFYDFKNAISQSIQNIIIKPVTEYDVYEKDLLFPQKIDAFPGCMKMHQIVWTFDSNIIAARNLSCTDMSCIEEAILCPHGKHLGFYTLPSKNTVDAVVPIAESTREINLLREQGWCNIMNASGKQDCAAPSNYKQNKVNIISNILIKPAYNTVNENRLLLLEETHEKENTYTQAQNLPNIETLENLMDIDIPLWGAQSDSESDDLNIF
ncbi:uncharacterized protein LOC142977668 [Anticarsia gemmatalis]|uniref:uncharacterized protein LOC142977668 n=1 Tax=Anticarsia gemmatalis TaxID=129554 RepID=UPI003F76BD73